MEPLTTEQLKNKYGQGRSPSSEPSFLSTKLTTEELKKKYGISKAEDKLVSQEKGDGIIKSLVKAPATILARPFQAAAALGGVSDEAIDRFSKEKLGGFVAPTPDNFSDVKKDVGRGVQTVAFGMPGLASGGAAFGLGASLEQGNKFLSKDSAIQAGIGAVGGKVLGAAAKPVLNLAGKAVSKVAPQALKDVASQGAKAVEEFAANRQILPRAASKAINTGAQVAETIANKPFEIAGKGAKAVLPKPKNIMNRVARLTPTDAAKFEMMTGKSHGQYLTETGNFGKPEKIVENEYKKFIASKQSADDALGTLPGIYQDKSVKTAIDELIARENRIGFGGGDAGRIQTLANKYENGGLNMKEINEVKRLFERNNKLDYLRGNVPEGIEKSNRIDNAIRNWQFRKADALGLKNLPELNKQTQASKFIVDKLGKQIAGRVGNEAITITDWILLSGGDPTAVAGLFAKKFFGNKTVQSKIAKSLAPKPNIGLVKPKYGSSEGFLLPAPKKGAQPFSTLPMGSPRSPTSFEAPAQKINRTRLPGQLQLPAGNRNAVNGPTLRLPASVREQNLGLDEIRNLNKTNLSKDLNPLAQEARKYKSAEEFVKYHKTGSIPSGTYDDSLSSLRESNLLKKENNPIRVGEVNGYEIRESGKPNKYTKTDGKGNIVRDKEGNATFLSSSEMRTKRLPETDTTIVAYDGETPIGYVMDSFGSPEVVVAKDYQGKGIGTGLLEKWLLKFPPGKKIGQMTPEGEAMTRSLYKKLYNKAVGKSTLPKKPTLRRPPRK